MSSERPQEVITALGVCCALGDDVASVRRALMAAEPRVALPPFALPFATVVGAVQGPLEPLPTRFADFDTRLARIAQRAIAQVTHAVERARARYGRERVGVLVGTSTGGLDSTEPAYQRYRRKHEHGPSFALRRAHAFDALSLWIRESHGLGGPCYALSTACTSSAKALVSARRLLRQDVCDAVLVVGADALCETTLRGFHALSILSTQPSRPFSSARDGIHLGEAAALLLLEKRADGPVLLRGCGESSDAYSMAAPHPEGAGAALAMHAALRDADVLPAQVSYINAHGTGTAQNDAAEAHALHAVFGAQMPALASTKGATGHTLGASGALEAIFAALSVMYGELPASVGAQPVDPELRLAPLSAGQKRAVPYALSNTFAFGGSNVSLLLGAP